MAEIDWRMSASLANVARGDSDLPEVTSLEGAARTWLALDTASQDAAVLTPERAVPLDSGMVVELKGQAIRSLAEQLPDLP
ncbi:hypothetical protein [Sphingomonas beigongshangi]|uniref:hypothetical protein n=2 Tax=Sphingomonas TaxID=13687 RepID=UPI00193B962B|nr:hypothetical protein [Sphingomonas beigongshangi]